MSAILRPFQYACSIRSCPSLCQVRFPVVVFGIKTKTTRASVTSDYGAAAYECAYSGLVSSLMKVSVSTFFAGPTNTYSTCNLFVRPRHGPGVSGTRPAPGTKGRGSERLPHYAVGARLACVSMPCSLPLRS